MRAKHSKHDYEFRRIYVPPQSTCTFNYMRSIYDYSVFGERQMNIYIYIFIAFA